MTKLGRSVGLALIALFLISCSDSPLNNPHPKKEAKSNIYYSVFSERPKTLDPAKAYASNEALFTGQIYEPPLQYNFVKRPYTLEPLTLVSMPKIEFKNNQTVYTLEIRPNIYYQPHPAFTNKDKNKKRELVAADYVYQIKRLAHPNIHSPIYGLMSEYIVGLKAYGNKLNKIYKVNKNIDLKKHDIAGVKILGKYKYQIIIDGQYPQFKYWLAMPFFSPMAYEVVEYYKRTKSNSNNMGLDWYPVGTGPYMLTINNPNQQMVMEKNPNFRGEVFNNRKIPSIDKYIFVLEKESIPRWHKFLQGYYDSSGVGGDNFDEAIKIDKNGRPELTEKMVAKKIKLQTYVGTSIYYLGFNMLDPIVGGKSERARKLRQAINMAMDYDEYIEIFLNGRGIAAKGPIPPGIFGYVEKSVNKNINQAKILLNQAGYVNGIDPKTSKPLVLNYDVPVSSAPDDKARFDWMRKQFKKLGIELNIRGTQYNRFQQKVRQGNAQLFSWGWLADYPDPENFLFLLYGPNGKVKYFGENASNYANPKFDKLFAEMKVLPNGMKRQKIINKMVAILQHDQPWVFGFHPKQFSLTHHWLDSGKPNAMANNTLKYNKIDYVKRQELRKQWNKPIFYPLIIILSLLFLGFIWIIIRYWKDQHA